MLVSESLREYRPTLQVLESSRHRALAANERSERLASASIALGACTLVVIGLMAYSPVFVHWFIVPILLSGVIIGVDAVDWLRGRMDTFDPAGLLGIYGLYYFLVSPCLQLILGDTLREGMVRPGDWRPWIGIWAAMNVAGLLLYRMGRTIGRDVTGDRPSQTLWRAQPRILVPLLIGACALSAATQLWVYSRFGGTRGYVDAFVRSRAGADEFQFMGRLFMISEALPILLVMLLVVIPTWRQWLAASGSRTVVLALVFVLLMYFGGLRGSRSNTVFSLFWVAGIVHLSVRRLRPRTMLLAAAAASLFMYLYGFYKSAGLEALSALDAKSRGALVQKTGRSFEIMLVGDLGRSDVQSLLLYRVLDGRSSHQYAWGATYFGALALIIPKQLWPSRPTGKLKYGTDVQFGQDAYRPGTFSSQRVYGLAGEALLNFGPIAFPLVFAPFGVAIGVAQRVLERMRRDDVRACLMPLVVLLCVLALSSDLDNMIVLLFKLGLFPFLVVFLGSERCRLRQSPGAAPRIWGMRNATRVHQTANP